MYQANQYTSHPMINDNILVASNTYHLPYWLETPPSLDYILHTLPSNESIMEVMSLDEMPWKDDYHRSSFLPDYHMVEDHFETMISSDIVTTAQSPVLIHNFDSKVNLSNITKTDPVDIPVNPGVVENIHVGQNSFASELKSYTTLFKEIKDIFAWMYEEILGIDPSIVVHEIRTYPYAKLVC